MPDAMTSRERIVAALEGRPVDRLPFCPFLAYYWDSVAEEVRDRGLLAFLHEIGADPLWRGDAWGAPCPTRRRVEGVEHRRYADGPRQITETITPVGTLREVRQASAEANTTYLTGFPLQGEEDYKVQLWIEEHTSTAWTDPGVLRAAVAQEGLALGMIIPEGRTAWARLIQQLAGTESLAYALADFPETVEALLAAMVENDLRAVHMAAESEYSHFLGWENTSTQNYSPAMFRRYNAPELAKWCRILRASGKRFVHHACGHLLDLLADIKACGVSAIESIAAPPTGNISMSQARAIAGGDMGIIGGVEPTHLLTLPPDELEPYVEEVVQDCGGGPFVLANSDSCPPGVTVEKLKLIAHIARRHR